MMLQITEFIQKDNNKRWSVESPTRSRGEKNKVIKTTYTKKKTAIAKNANNSK